MTIPLSLENTTGMLSCCFFFLSVHSFIDDFCLRLGAIFEIFFIVLELHAHHECDTLSNGNTENEYRMNHFSHNVELYNTARGDDTGFEFQYGFRQKFHS